MQSDSIKVMSKLDLNISKGLISKANLLIGNDTGSNHMVWALNRLSIITPVSKQEYSIKDKEGSKLSSRQNFYCRCE